MAGGVRISARNSGLIILALLVGAYVGADELYKYRGEDGEWIYSDRPPPDDRMVEIRQLETTGAAEVGIKVTHEFEGRAVELVAHNDSYVPIELELTIRTIRGLEFPDPDDDLKWVVPARTDLPLMSLGLLETGTQPFLEYQYKYLAGDPNARHAPRQAYRAPFAIATNHPITQAFPEVATHTTRDSHYAVDVAKSREQR